jgi:hypothetical protein
MKRTAERESWEFEEEFLPVEDYLNRRMAPVGMRPGFDSKLKERLLKQDLAAERAAVLPYTLLALVGLVGSIFLIAYGVKATLLLLRNLWRNEDHR